MKAYKILGIVCGGLCASTILAQSFYEKREEGQHKWQLLTIKGGLEFEAWENREWKKLSWPELTGSFMVQGSTVAFWRGEGEEKSPAVEFYALASNETPRGLTKSHATTFQAGVSIGLPRKEDGPDLSLDAYIKHELDEDNEEGPIRNILGGFGANGTWKLNGNTEGGAELAFEFGGNTASNGPEGSEKASWRLVPGLSLGHSFGKTEGFGELSFEAAARYIVRGGAGLEGRKIGGNVELSLEQEITELFNIKNKDLKISAEANFFHGFEVPGFEHKQALAFGLSACWRF